MKTRKIVSLLLSVAMVLSMASAVYAAPSVSPASENPTVTVTPIAVNGAGKAVIELRVLTEGANFKAYEAKVETNQETWEEETTYFGKGISAIQVDLTLNEKYFNPSTETDVTYAGTAAALKAQSNGAANKVRVSAPDGISESGWFASENLLVTRILVPTELSLEELQKKTDLVSYDLVVIRITAYPVAGSKVSGEAEGWEYSTTYASDGNSTYEPILKTGADAPVVEDVIVNDETPVESTITVDGKQEKVKVWEDVSVSAGLVGTGKIKAVLTNTQTSETQDVALTFAQEFTGDNDVVFDVIVKFLDYANAPYVNLEIVKVTE